MKKLKVVVTTPVHNRRELTLNCIRSFFQADLSGIEPHFIVVDDGSTDGTSEAVGKEFPEVELIRGDGNLWYTGGTNAGLKAAIRHDPDYVLAINDDTRFDPHFLQSMISTAAAHPRSVVGAVLVNWDEPEKIFQVAPKWSVWWGGNRHWCKQTVHTVPDRPWKVELIVGNCVLFPADAIREVGFMDEKRLPHAGDAEYTPRMRKAGWTLLIDPAVRVFCKPNDVPERIRSLSFRSMVSKIIFDPYYPHSLKRRINMTVGSAPNKLQGYAALAVFGARLLLGKNVEGRWALEQEERPLAEIYKNDLV